MAGTIILMCVIIAVVFFFACEEELKQSRKIKHLKKTMVNFFNTKIPSL